ncbi:MAG TPA: SufD family Fe-S cluster assembly protein [Solirubrobacteraceae bacterium]
MPDGVATKAPPVKPGAHREAVLYRALNGAGAGPAPVEELRERAREAYERLELPTWRRSGFWTTSLRDLDLDALTERTYAPGGPLPAAVAEGLPRGDVAGRLVQHGSTVIRAELDPELRERGVVLCALDEAPPELVERWLMSRLPLDRDKLEAASAALWSGGAFLYVPPGVVVDKPFDVVYAIDEPGTAQYGHTLAVGDEGSDFRLRHFKLAPDLDGPALHAGQVELYLEANARCRFAPVQDWGGGSVVDVSTQVVRVGRDAYVHWLPSYLGGSLSRQHLELAVAEPGGDMAFRGVFFAERDEHLDLFAVDLHETGPSGGDVHWRGAATGQAKASFEGLIQINPGAQQSHTYLQIHTMMLSPRAKVDAIPSVLVSADDVSASHGGTVGELDEALIFYMRSRGLSRAEAVHVIVEGFFEPLIGELEDEGLEELVRDKIGEKLQAAAADVEAYAAAR